MKKIYLPLLTCLFLAGCNKFEDDINVNPNLPNEASGTQLIANAALYLPGMSSSPQGEFLAQYLAETQFVTSSLYPEGGTDTYGLYEDPLKNLQVVLDNPEALSGVDGGPVENQLAVAKIMKAYFFWQITDRWGDVPYTESLKGTNDLTPEYDTQESIYNNLFDLLEGANSQIVEGDISNDIVYGGDMSKWKKLGNTIRLLMALRLSEVNPSKGAEEFDKALNAGIMESNDDNLVFLHVADANNQNYWYGQIVIQNREWWALTENLVETMKPTEDPRLEVYGEPARATGEYKGLKYGTEDGSLLGTTEHSLLGSDIYAQDAPVYLVTYPQVLFAKAEASVRGWINEDPETLYNMAIEQSVQQWTVSDQGVEDLLNNPEVTYDSSRAIELISEQRWIHLFMNGYEAWAEWRRTGYPDHFVSPGGKDIPTRLMYPASEVFNNTENFNAAIERQFGGNNGLYGKVWWDVN